MGAASDKYAAIIRSQYDDWLTRYYPEQQKLMSLATDNSLMNTQLNRVSENSANSLANAQTANDNRMARMGVSTATDSNDNSLGLSSALSSAQAKNGIRSAEQDRQLSILSGADGGLRSTMLNSSTQL